MTYREGRLHLSPQGEHKTVEPHGLHPRVLRGGCKTPPYHLGKVMGVKGEKKGKCLRHFNEGQGGESRDLLV